MSEVPGNKWAQAAVVVLAGFTAFLTAYREFASDDAIQNDKISKLVTVICLENEARAVTCQRLELIK